MGGRVIEAGARPRGCAPAASGNGRRARRGPALLAFLLLVGLPARLPAAALCPPDHLDAQVRVDYVYDGDTLTLTDGRRVRLIGMDAPEMGRDGHATQPGAVAARDRLRALVRRAGRRLGLRYDLDRHDRYGRLLAHLFLPDGDSVTARLLREGRGVPLVIPPNVWHAGCYGKAAAAARRERRGIWRYPRYRPVAARALPARAHGFHIVRGRVRHLGRGRHRLWLDLPGKVALYIQQQDLRWFRSYDPTRLQGRRVEAMGWIHRRHGERRMRIRHPSALRVLD